MPINEARFGSGQAVAAAQPAGRPKRPEALRNAQAAGARTAARIRGKLAQGLGGIVSIFAIGGAEERARQSTADLAARLARIEVALDDAIAAASSSRDAEVLTVGRGLLTDMRRRLAAVRSAGTSSTGERELQTW